MDVDLSSELSSLHSVCEMSARLVSRVGLQQPKPERIDFLVSKLELLYNSTHIHRPPYIRNQYYAYTETAKTLLIDYLFFQLKNVFFVCEYV